MLPILQKLMLKRGIEDPNDFSKEEKETFDQWQAVLTKDKLTTEDIRNFCLSQVDIIEARWTDLSIEQPKKAEMIPYHTVYKLLIKAIDSPKEARNALEKNLTQLLYEH